MRILLDTCAISEFRQTEPNAALIKLIRQTPNENVYISVISLGEIIKGVSLLPEGKRRKDLESWARDMEFNFIDRILPIDIDVARIWAEITASAHLSGFTIPIPDGLIAATAHLHGLHIVTRNEKDFLPTGSLVINPWKE